MRVAIDDGGTRKGRRKIVILEREREKERSRRLSQWGSFVEQEGFCRVKERIMKWFESEQLSQVLDVFRIE